MLYDRPRRFKHKLKASEALGGEAARVVAEPCGLLPPSPSLLHEGGGGRAAHSYPRSTSMKRSTSASVVSNEATRRTV